MLCHSQSLGARSLIFEPPKFSGDPNSSSVKAYKLSASIFLSQFEEYSELQKFRFLNDGIEGDARNIVELHKERIGSPEDFYQVLAKFFAFHVILDEVKRGTFKDYKTNKQHLQTRQVTVSTQPTTQQHLNSSVATPNSQ